MIEGDRMRRATCLGIAFFLVLTLGCDLLDPARPTAQPDEEVFGNLVEVTPNADDPALWTVLIRVGPPRALRHADEESGKPTPAVEQGLIATVTVGPDTVVIANDRPAELEEIPSGTEVVVVPVPGTTQIVGSSDLRLQADMLMDFQTYGLWKLPKLTATSASEPDDPQRINSSGSEAAPVPVAGGRVLYFSASLRPPATPEDSWHGALRDGLPDPQEGGGVTQRTYRTEMGDDGWSAPELVVFPGPDDAIQQRVSWVSGDEKLCVVTVVEEGEAPWVGVSQRSTAAAPWGEIAPIEGMGSQAHDAVYLTGSRTKMVFGSDRGGRERDDLFLFDPAVETGPLPLQPEICTFGSEWGPRTGPENELFFCREDRQLLYQGGQVKALRLPGSHRAVFTQTAPTDDGKWVFLCMPKFRPIVVDEDIYVAPVVGEGWSLGTPVPVDDWRP
jgi:hypothetical protein